MAVTTSTETANLGHATAVASKAWERSSRRGTVAQRFALPVKIPNGSWPRFVARTRTQV